MKELLFSVTRKDLDIQFFSSGGPGGQHQNKTASGCRIIHRESGAVGESRETRSQLQNKKLALQRLVNSKKFQSWWKVEAAKHMQSKARKQYIEDWIAKTMKQDVKIEVKENDRWREATQEEIDKMNNN